MKYTLFLFCVAITFCACKKEKKDPITFQGSNQTISTDSINGEFTIRKLYHLNNDSLVFEEMKAFAQFFQAKKSKYSTINTPNVNVGNVFLNGVQFFVDPTYNTYIDSTGTFFTMPYNWQISGSAIHPAFNFTDNTNFPIYLKADLPDTIIVDQQDTIKIGNYSGSSVSISIQSAAAMVVKSIEYPVNQLIIQPNEIYYSGAGPEEGWIFIGINNSDYKPINGRMYRFNSITMFYKPIILIHS